MAKDELDDTDKEILRLKYTNRKLGVRQIGKLLTKPLSHGAVNVRMNKSKFKTYWDQLERDIILQIKEAQTEAMNVILQTLRSKDQKLKFQAAKTIIEPILANCPQLLPEMINTEDLEWDISEVEKNT